MIVYRRRGWIAILLYVVAIWLPAFTLHDRPFEKYVATASLLLAEAMFLYWFGTRSMRREEEHLERPLPWYERIVDYREISLFDSFAYVHLRWWGLAFALGAIYAGVKAYE